MSNTIAELEVAVPMADHYYCYHKASTKGHTVMHVSHVRVVVMYFNAFKGKKPLTPLS